MHPKAQKTIDQVTRGPSAYPQDLPHFNQNMLVDYYVNGTPLPIVEEKALEDDSWTPHRRELMLREITREILEMADGQIYGYIFFLMNKRFVRGDGEVPTAGVRMRKMPNGVYQLCLDINVDFFFGECTTKKVRRGIILHEVLHVLFKHLDHRQLGDTRHTPLKNVAYDLANNSVIGNYNEVDKGKYTIDLTDFPGAFATKQKVAKEWTVKEPEIIAITVDEDGKPHETMSPQRVVIPKDTEFDEVLVTTGACFPLLGEMAALPPKLSSEVYYRLLIKEGFDNQSLLNMLAEQHDWFKDVEEGEMSECEGAWGGICRGIKNAINDYISQGKGTSYLRRMLETMWLAQPDYDSILSHFYASNQREREPSWVRENRRGIKGYCGHQYENLFNIAVFVDQSGSMDDDEVARCFGRMFSLLHHAVVTVYHFADEIDFKTKHEIASVAELVPRRTVTGGTSFMPIFKYMSEQGHDYDAAIIMTDMGAAVPPVPVHNICFMYEMTNHWGTREAASFRSKGHTVIEVQ